MKGKRGQNVCPSAIQEDVKMAENIQSCWENENYASKINDISQSKKEQSAVYFLGSTEKFTVERYDFAMLWGEPETNLPKNYVSEPDQLFSTERSFLREPELKELYQQSIDTDDKKGFVKILGKPEFKGTLRKI